MAQDAASRQSRKWSVNSDFFHSRDCPAVARISKANIRSGVAPDSLKPHDCVLASKADNTTRVVGATPAGGSVPSVPASQSGAIEPNAASGIAMAFAPPATTGHAGAAASAASDHANHHGASGDESCDDPINPYCSCNPCRCTPPCTCGLRKTETQRLTQWDSNQQLLRHITTVIYRPDPAKILNSKAHHDDSSGAAAATSAPGRHSVVAIEQALSQSANSQIRQAMVKSNVLDAAGAGVDVHGHPASVRKAEHRGNLIELKTSYEISINGEPLNVHIGVLNDGKVHCHSIPNYSSASGIDLIKAIIDAFPDDYPSRD